MSSEKLTLMAVSKTLLSLKGPVSDVRPTFHGFKSGPMALSLDARMHSAQMDWPEGQLRISWTTSEQQGNAMTSETNATLTKSIILSEADERLTELKYKPGDRFYLKLDNFDGWNEDLIQLLKDRKVLIEVESFELTVDGDIAYRLSFLRPNLDCRWQLTEEELDESFLYLGKGSDKLRFLLLDE
jgi:hypothetical protein